MNYFFHPEAEEEFLGAIEYYEQREENLGRDFAVEVYAAISRAAAFPNAWPRSLPKSPGLSRVKS